MPTKYYIAPVDNGTDSRPVIGPFGDYSTMLGRACEIHARQTEEDELFWIHVDNDGVPFLGLFTDAELEPEGERARDDTLVVLPLEGDGDDTPLARPYEPRYHVGDTVVLWPSTKDRTECQIVAIAPCADRNWADSNPGSRDYTLRAASGFTESFHYWHFDPVRTRAGLERSYKL